MSETEVMTKTTKTTTTKKPRRTRKTAGTKKTATKKTASSGTTKKRVRRVKKSKTVEETTTPTVEETVAPVETVAPATTEETTTTSSTETVQTAGSTETTTSTDSSSTTTTEATTETLTTQVSQNLETVNTAFTDLNTQIGALVKLIHSSGFGNKELRVVGRTYKNTLKVLTRVQDELLSIALKRGDDAQRQLNKRVRKHRGKSNPNSGIQKMHPAHPLLATFMGEDEGAPVSRVQALKAISTYVREHELQVVENRRTFYCKGDLHNLFPERETMGYTDIMREIKPFFPAKQATN